MKKEFEYYIKGNAFHFKYAKCEPSVKGQEFHDYNEFVLFLGGKARFISKNGQKELAPENLIIIPREEFHRFIVEEPENYTRCILGFSSTPETNALINEVMDTARIITKPRDKIKNVFENLIEVVKSNLSESEKALYINASISQILINLKLNPQTETSENFNLSPSVVTALSIIDEKFSEKLTVKTLSELVYVSPSTLSHKFRKELNISVYEYITKKRLSIANELIKEGKPMTSVALLCGFRDYSCFYRLYKKYYK